ALQHLPRFPTRRSSDLAGALMAARWQLPLMLLAAGMAQAGEVKAESANSGTAPPAAGTDEPVGILEISERREYYVVDAITHDELDRKSTRLNSSHVKSS